MRTRLIKAVLFVLPVGLLATFVLASSVAAEGRPLSTTLTGAAEVPPADPDGTGTANITLNQGQGEVCFDLTVANIAPPTRSHIHNAPAGTNGPIVVPFFEANNVTLSGCVSADPDLIKDIRQNPENYYVNVHNAEFPGGAIRGQLSK